MDPAYLTPVIVAAVPLAVMLLKKVISPAPWVLPILAGALGVAADALAAYALNVPVSPQVGAVLGLAGVGLREIVDQLKKAAA